jgi:hypothetical protein
MIIHKPIKKKSRFRWIIITSIVLGLSTILLFLFFIEKLQNYYSNKWIKESTENNVFICHQNNLYPYENPSLRIIIDDKEIESVDSMSKLKKVIPMRLGNGKHIIQISTMSNDYLYVDTINITNSLVDYSLFISFDGQTRKHFDIIFNDLLFE